MNQVKNAGDVNYLKLYFEQFYNEMTPENALILAFLAKVSLNNPGPVLDLGCGPTYQYWNQALVFANRSVGIDLRADNIDYVGGVIKDLRMGNVHSRYLDVSRHVSRVLETLDTNMNSEEVLYRLLNREHELMARNLLHQPWSFADESFQVIMSCFGIDHMPSEDGMRSVLREARRVIRMDGVLSLVTLAETTTWHNGQEVAACLYSDEKIMRSRLRESGFSVDGLKFVPADNPERDGYPGIMLITAHPK